MNAPLKEVFASIIVLYVFFSRIYLLGREKCSFYSVCRIVFCLLFRLIGGKSSKSQERLAPPLPTQEM